MAVTAMKKIQIIGHQTQRGKVIDLLQRLGKVQIMSSPSAELPKEDIREDIEIWEKKNSGLNFAIEFLRNYKKGGPGLIEGFFPSPIIMNEQQWKREQERFIGFQVVNRCQEISSKLNEIHNRITHLKAGHDFLHPWQNLSIPLENVVSTQKTRVQAGTLPLREGEEFSKEIQQKNLPAHLELVNRTTTTLYVIIIYWAPDEVSSLLQQYHFSPVDFSGYRGGIISILHKISEEIAQLQGNEEQLQQEAKDLARYYEQLLIEYDYCLMQKQKKEALLNFLQTRKAFVVEGWIRAKDVDLLTKQLEELTSEIVVWIRAPHKDEAVPVEIENSPAVRPFEIITRLYGMPHSRELDPTPFLAPFFILFFAICLSDAGYGIILSLGGYFLVRQARRRGKDTKFGWFFVYAGLMTVVIGGLMGGWFGDLFQRLSWEPLRRMQDQFMIFDPLKNLIIFLIIVLSLGWIQVLVGLGIKAFQNLRQGKILDALVDQIAWMVILVSVVIFVLARMKKIPSFGEKLALSGGVVGALSILGFGGRESRSIIGRLAMGAFRLYGVSSYFSDILSYSRLLALGLASGIIALTINLMGGFFRQIPYVGIALWILVLTGGHIFNLIINTLGAFVHSCRLQYVEFFPKFFEGGGKIFRPFREEREYTVVFPTKR